MTDIVERLRNRALATEIINGNPALYNDAADVIISLCAENEKLRHAIKQYADKTVPIINELLREIAIKEIG